MQDIPHILEPSDQRFELFSNHTPKGMLQTLVGRERPLLFERWVRVDGTWLFHQRVDALAGALETCAAVDVSETEVSLGDLRAIARYRHGAQKSGRARRAGRGPGR